MGSGEVAVKPRSCRPATARPAIGDPRVSVRSQPRIREHEVPSGHVGLLPSGAGAASEFHPVNDTDPYKDNACTATKRLHGDDIPASLRNGAVDADTEPDPESDNDIAAAGALAGVAVASAEGPPCG